MSSSNKTRLEACCKSLRLSGVQAYYEELSRAAEQETMRYEEYLLELLLRECEVRYNNRIARLLRESRLPLEKNLQNFDTSGKSSSGRDIRRQERKCAGFW